MKAFASDFDGTLYFSSLKEGYKKEDLVKIKEFQSQGHLFGICTGRPMIGIEDNLKDIVNLDFYIVTTGALILDKDKNILFERYIEEKTVRKLYDIYKDITNFFFQTSEAVYTFKTGSVNIVQTVIDDINEVKGKVYGISLNAMNEENAQRICKEIKYYFHDLDAFQNKEYIDIVKKGCSKGNAVQKVKDILHADLIAGIGDSYNDIPMLESADISFTFYDSPDIVKEKADFIVNGICEAIEKI